MKREEIKSIVMKIAESVMALYEEDETPPTETADMDVTKAIEDGDYKFGLWKKERKIYIGNARIFSVCVSQKDGGNMWRHLSLFFFNGSVTATYFSYDRPINDPWKFRSPPASFNSESPNKVLEITPEFKKEIIENEALREILKKHIVSNAGEKESEAIIQKQFNGLTKVDIEKNNRVIERVKADDKQRADDKRIADYANEQQKKLGRKYRYYREYYRGEHAIAHDDDYAGSGETSLSSIAFAMNCKTEEDVDKLIVTLHDHGISKVSDHHRTNYWEDDEK